MKAFAIVVLALCVACAHASWSHNIPVNFTDCGSKLMTVTGITASAWPPSSGAVLSLAMSGTASQDITAGTYTSTSYYEGINVQSEVCCLCIFPLFVPIEILP